LEKARVVKNQCLFFIFRDAAEVKFLPPAGVSAEVFAGVFKLAAEV
jgi:hypothetical protein